MTKYELFYFVQFQKRFSQEPIGISKNVTHFVSLLSAEWCSSVCLAVCGNVEVCNSVKQMAANWWFKACIHLTLKTSIILKIHTFRLDNDIYFSLVSINKSSTRRTIFILNSPYFVDGNLNWLFFLKTEMLF